MGKEKKEVNKEIEALQQEISRLKENFRFLLDSIPQKIFYKDRNSVYIACNRSYARDLGIKPEEIEGKNDYEFFPKELAEKYRADDQRIMRKGEIEEFDESYIKDGIEYTIHTIKAPVRDQKGEIIGILGIFWDITDRKRMEEELRRSEEHFRLISEKTSDMIIITTFELNPVYTYVSPSIKNIMGYNPEELIGKPALAGIHPEDRELIIPILKEYLEKRKGLEGTPDVFERLEYRVRDKWGKWRFLESTVNIMKDELLFISRDITERKETEKKLRELSKAVEQSPAVVVITDADARIEYVNPKFEELTGYTFEEVSGKNPRILKSGLTPVETYKKLWDTILKGEIWRGEFINRKKNGEIYYESASISPVKDEKGKITHFVAVKLDITKQKMDEIALKRSEERYKIISQLISDIAVSLIYNPDGSFFVEWIAGRPEIITGYTVEELKEKECMKKIIFQEDSKVFEEHLRKLLTGNTSTCEYRIITKDGKIRWLSDYGYSVKDENGTIRLYKAFQDITERKMVEEALQKEVIRDPLTGLFNRRFMTEFIKKEMKRSERYKHNIGFLLIDINNFKEINDRYGHIVGDKVLQITADALQRSVRQSDVVVRYGGDEFLIILTETNGEVEKVKERIKEIVENVYIPELKNSITLSIGCSYWSPDQPRTLEAILSEADQKMYEEKKKSKLLNKNHKPFS